VIREDIGPTFDVVVIGLGSVSSDEHRRLTEPKLPREHCLASSAIAGERSILTCFSRW